MCKHEQASIERQLELMKSGKVRTGEDIGSGWIETTEESVERADACHEDPAKAVPSTSRAWRKWFH